MASHSDISSSSLPCFDHSILLFRYLTCSLFFDLRDGFWSISDRSTWSMCIATDSHLLLLLKSLMRQSATRLCRWLKMSQGFPWSMHFRGAFPHPHLLTYIFTIFHIFCVMAIFSLFQYFLKFFVCLIFFMFFPVFDIFWLFSYFCVMLIFFIFSR